MLIRTDLRTSAEFEQTIIRNSGGVLVRLADIGRAEDARAIKVAFDRSIFIEKSIDPVYTTMLEAMYQNVPEVDATFVLVRLVWSAPTRSTARCRS